MPHIPTTSALTANSVGIINAIRNEASAEYYNAVPAANETTESIRMVGEAICAMQPRMNEFINALVNRIGRVVITSRLYQNPWAFAKKGILDFGETIEEIFVDLAKAHPYKPEREGADVWKRNKPDVSTMFHSMNSQVFYPVTISEAQLRQAFTSMDGVTNLIARIVDSLYSAANYDEFIMMKYIIARLALSGALPVIGVTGIDTEADTKATLKRMRATASKMAYMSTDYTIAGVRNYVDKGDLYVITTADFNATADLDALAYAFNIDRADWMGRHVEVDQFAFNASELQRLAEIMADDPGYAQNPITEDDNTALAGIHAIAMGSKFWQVYDVHIQFTEIFNPATLEWQEFLHQWKIYSASPFENVAMFITGTPGVTAVTVTGASEVEEGNTYTYTAGVSANDFANKGVVWSISAGNGTGNVTIDQLGRVHVPEGATGTWVVKATSVADSTKVGQLEITVA